MRTPAPRPPGTRRALVVATGSYTDPAITQLRAPALDAQDMIEVLADEDIGGFTVTSIMDGAEAQIRRTVSVFLAGCARDDLVLIYLSCHGLLSPRGRLYFAASDTVKAHLRATAVEAQWLLEEMDECAARRQVLILDCCFSGAFAGKGDADLDLDRRLGGPGRGRAVLTASRSTEYSFEGEPLSTQPLPRSVFTSALVAGLRSGEADRDGDGYISVEDAFAYAADRVAAGDPRQNPQRWLFGAEKEIILARSPLGAPVVAAPLPEALRSGLDSPYPQIRRGAVNELGQWLASPDIGRALAAQQVLQVVASEDAPVVATLARELLHTAGPPPTAAPRPRAPAKRQGPDNRSFKGFPGRVGAVAFSPDGTLVAAAAADRVVLFDVESGKQVGKPLLGHRNAVWTVAFAPDGRRLATGGVDSTVRLWDAVTREQTDLTLTHHSRWVRAVAFSPDGKTLASASEDGGVGLWDVARESSALALLTYAKAVNSLAYSPDGAVIATGGDDHLLQFWQPGRAVAVRGHSDAVLAVAFHPGGKLLASAGRDRTVRLWDLSADSARERTANQHKGWVHSVAFSPDGALLASACQDGRVDLYAVPTLEPVRAPAATHTDGANAVAFSPDGTLLASGGDDGLIRVNAV